jgi:hypothetical protein
MTRSSRNLPVKVKISDAESADSLQKTRSELQSTREELASAMCWRSSTGNRASKQWPQVARNTDKWKPCRLSSQSLKASRRRPFPYISKSAMIKTSWPYLPKSTTPQRLRRVIRVRNLQRRQHLPGSDNGRRRANR